MGVAVLIVGVAVLIVGVAVERSLEVSSEGENRSPAESSS